MNLSFEDSDDDELEVVIDGYEGHENFNNVEEMVDDEGSEPEGGENSHHDFDRRRGGRDPRVEEDSQTDDAVTPTVAVTPTAAVTPPAAAGEEAHEQVNDIEELNNNGLSMPQRKRKDPAPVWNQCADRLDGGKGKCNFCSKIFTCTGGSTSTLVAHLRSKHSHLVQVKNLINEINLKKMEAKLENTRKRKREEASFQPSITNFTGRRGVIDPVKKRKIDDALVRMTIGMDQPFDNVENFYLRELVFVLEPNYICPSRARHTRNFDKAALKVKEDLKNEIVRDITEAGHKTISITSDHGTSADKYRTKKNALTLARTTKNFVIKKDTITLIHCEGSQTGAKIRSDVKKALMLGAGWKEDWTVNWVTDNESKQANARDPTKHPQVGMKTYYTGKTLLSFMQVNNFLWL
jgi:hypothetical protein